MNELERAWTWREKTGCFSRQECVRVFHGPVEGSGGLSGVIIDRFGPWCWVTEREGTQPIDEAIPRMIEFFRSKKITGAVMIRRPKKGIPAESEPLYGPEPPDELVVSENGLRFTIRFLGTRHPGLFLDHEPLRAWLIRSSQGLRVLNTFAYTGSLSVAAAAGGAEHVTTLDLSRPAVQWAEKNWKLNALPMDRAKFIVGDVFEWLPRLARGSSKFDCVILDPPSFAHGEKKRFSTSSSQDLVRLHRMALDALAPEGVLVTSINSAGVSVDKLRRAVLEAALALGRTLEVVRSIEQPETFPSRLEDEGSRYLKGWVLRVRSRRAERR